MIAATVANKSTLLINESDTLPASVFPGQRAMNAMRNTSETNLNLTVVLIRKFGSYRNWVT